MMHAREKSDSAIVAGKPTNKAERSAAEPVEPRGGDQGECEPAKHAPDTESGKRDPGAGTRTESSKQKEEGEVHRALPSHQRRTSRSGVLRTPRECRSRRGRADVASLSGRPRAQSRGHARTASPGGVSAAAITAGLHSKAGWTTAPPRRRCAGRQDRSAGGDGGAQRDLRGRFPRVLVWIPTRARRA